MPRGGKREGAGRKPGTATLKTREAADIAAKDGCSPLAVLDRLMKYFYAKAFAVDQDGKEVVDEDMMTKAGAWAMAAAPYCHPRLQATTAEPATPPPIMDESGRLEYARRLAFVLINGVREQSKTGRLLTEKK